MVRFLKQFFKEKETFTEKNHITEVARKSDHYFRNIPFVPVFYYDLSLLINFHLFYIFIHSLNDPIFLVFLT